jgi:20S proteasome subunit alpha 7
MIAGYDARKKTHELYVLEPTGVCLRYFGAALGKGRQSAKSEIEKLDLTKLTCREALKEIAKMIYTTHDDAKDKPFILEFAWLCKETDWKYGLVPQPLIDEADAWAKKELESDDEEEDEEMAN